jgi:Domain of unknown function (DUF4326)
VSPCRSISAAAGNLIAWAKERGLFVRIDRATPWGSPFELGKDGDRETVIAAYRDHYLPFKPSLLERLGELRGKALACWCAPLGCYADVLAAAARREDGPATVRQRLRLRRPAGATIGTMQPVAAGTSSQLWVRGPQLAPDPRTAAVRPRQHVRRGGVPAAVDLGIEADGRSFDELAEFVMVAAEARVGTAAG